jgi:predicted dehydrogenase
MKIKAGIVGLGKMGLSHAAIVNPHPDVDLVSICDTSSIVLEAFRKFSRVRAYDDFKKMIDTERPDCLIVASPTKFHYEMVNYAIERGIHTFCEKPFSLTLEEGRELVRKAKEKGIINQVGFHNHFIGTFMELKRLLKSGILGELVLFSGEAYGPVVLREKGEEPGAPTQRRVGAVFLTMHHMLSI